MTASRILGRFLPARRHRVAVADLSDAATLWAVGDVHGRLDLYRRIEDRIIAEGQPATILLLGDLIDRGPESRGVIEHVLSPAPEGFRRLALTGNHEDMALRFLDDPRRNAAWLGWGGREMIASYAPGATGDDPEALAAALRAALPEAHLAFLRSLPVLATAGRYVLSHTGGGPETPLFRQTRTDLVWARHGETPDLIAPSDLAGRVMVHGHVPVAEARLNGWRINLDTGAYATGRLSAVCLTQDGDPRFISTADGR